MTPAAVRCQMLRGRVSHLSPCVSQSLRSDARRWPRGRVFHLSLCVHPCVSQSLRSDARRVSRLSLCLPVSFLPDAVTLVSPSLCGQRPDAVTPAPGSCLPLVSLCLRFCGQSDAVSWGRVSRLSFCVSQSRQSLRSAARCCDAGRQML